MLGRTTKHEPVAKPSDRVLSVDQDAVEARPDFLRATQGGIACSDYVSISTGPRGFMLAFGCNHPGIDKPVIFQEIYLPPDIGLKVYEILRRHIDGLVAKGALKETAEAESE